MLFSAKDWFQFHTGSIKSCAAIVAHCLPVNCFNSILVRLKDDKDAPIGCIAPESLGFNSILVRLKVIHISMTSM